MPLAALFLSTLLSLLAPAGWVRPASSAEVGESRAAGCVAWGACVGAGLGTSHLVRAASGERPDAVPRPRHQDVARLARGGGRSWGAPTGAGRIGGSGAPSVAAAPVSTIAFAGAGVTAHQTSRAVAGRGRLVPYLSNPPPLV